MSLYETIGVEPDADEKAVKAAYRRAAKKHHPDAGGDREAFEAVNRAWLVLQDPAKRARYDSTGETESEPDNKLSMVVSMMGAAFDAAMDKAQGQFELHNIVDLMVEATREKLDSVRVEISKGKRAIERTDKMIKRAQFKGKGSNMIAGILKDRRAAFANQVASMAKSEEGFASLIELLADYDWDVDESEQLDIEAMLGRPSFFANG